MIVVEVKGRDLKITWEIVGSYRALNEDMQVLKNCQTGPNIWEVLQSVASLEVVETYLMQI